MIIGIGARRGVNKEEVISAIESALIEVGKNIGDIDMLASSKIKENEAGCLKLLFNGKAIKIPFETKLIKL
jgi:cobalt-precorrin 5A hydrolase